MENIAMIYMNYRNDSFLFRLKYKLNNSKGDHLGTSIKIPVIKLPKREIVNYRVAIQLFSQRNIHNYFYIYIM